MNRYEVEYKALLKDILDNGEVTKNRTASPTTTMFNKYLEVDLTKGFPILTGKQIFFNKAYGEFLWIYEGRTDLEFLHKYKIRWWDDFAKDGKLGKIYGYQLRNFAGKVDQVDFAINELKNNSRRAHISLWNLAEFDEQVLPCCYTSFTFVRMNSRLNLSIHFRSSDVFLGLPYDVIFGALFLIRMAKDTGLKPHKLGLTLANAHVYHKNVSASRKYLKTKHFELPELSEDERLIGYEHGEYIKSPLVVD